jgi:dolichol-phosphate mannosyltransferase
LQLTLIIPTFNEANNLPKLVSVLFSLPIRDLKLLIVDDNSPDGTGEVARDLCKKFPERISAIIRPRKLGMGSAYLVGFQHTLDEGSEAIGQMDADFSHPPEKLIEMLNALESYDVVLGSRYVPGGKLDENWPLWRKGLSAFGNFYARTILNLPIQDATGGFRIFRRSTLMALPLDRISSNGYAFQIEVTYLTARLGFHIHEVPIYFADRRWGKSKMSLAIQLEAAKRVWQMLWEYRDLTPIR